MFHIDISHLSYESAMEALLSSLIDPNKVICQIDFDADHSRSKIIRDFVGHIFDIHNIHQPWRGRFILIADELINNAIEHGSSIGDIDSCIIDAQIDMTGELDISLEVHDTGNGKDAKDAQHMESIRAARLDTQNQDNGIYMAKRGRGLFHITEKLVDRLSFFESIHGGLAVKIEKRIKESQDI